MGSSKPVIAAITVIGALAGAIVLRAEAAALEQQISAPFGTFSGVEYLSYTGRFTGVTSKGAFDVPYEIVAPIEPLLGNGTVLMEPPHFAFGAVGRDIVLGRDLLFNSGFSYAAVGFGGNGLNVLDPAATPITIAGEQVADPGVPNPAAVLDFELLVQFVDTLKADPDATAILGSNLTFYSFGISQTSAVQLQILLGPEGQGLFEFNLMTLRFWPAVINPEPFDRLSGDFAPPSGIGRTIFVNTESEVIRSDAEQFRTAADDLNYRVYEIAGAPHFPQPPPLNPLDYNPVIRAAFVAGDNWIRWGVEPPLSLTIDETSGVDPVYGFETGIERDINGNALGGIRLPDVELGSALFIATNFVVPIPGIDPLFFGLWVDLQCEPLADGSVRFRNHGQYVSPFSQHANALVSQGYLLASDAEAMKAAAAQSSVGKRGNCD